MDDPDGVRTEDVIIHSWNPCPLYEREPGIMKREAKKLVRGHTSKLWPYSKITAGVLVMNAGQNGQLSDTITFETPEGGK